MKTGRIIERSIIVVSVIIIGTVAVRALDKKASDEIIEDILKEGTCPADMAELMMPSGNICVDIYENSSGGECIHDDPESQLDTKTNLDTRDCIPVSISNKTPWRNISQDQAALACAKAGKRLPTHEEWYYASMGTPDKNSGWRSDDCHVANNWNVQPGFTGFGAKCISSIGTYDMIGNVWEWVQGASKDGDFEGGALPDAGYVDGTDGNGLPGLTNTSEPNELYNNDYFYFKQSGLRGMARGGYWGNKSDAGQYSVYMVLPPSSAGAGIGFRCVK